MNRERYKKTMEWLIAHKRFTKTAIFTEKLCELAVYTIYPVFLLYLAVKGDEYFLRSALTCSIPFVLVSVLRKLLNAKRPYEVYGISAVMKKDKKGSSMPSRHVFSASIIAVSIFFVFPVLGIICGLLALIIAVERVLLGVHFIRDVLVGAVIGIVFGLAGSILF
ncbi:MAG: phosphatase PAP2 family protein [Clostridia bacterium]|nr:phosphatase PAP2 family protein [Clostridia bacterium]